ncbi:MAG: cation:proton antiporter [Desulfobacterales bacterium]|jgi:Kef-type K+ transport system membrane component KefB|nr:cation:proton antiporter [Desulfobacterales bacterium]
MNSHAVSVMLLSFGVLLCFARALGEVAQRLRQPAVLGELLAGVLLGPTVLGNVSPELGLFLFPPQGPNAVAMDTIATLAIVFFLMVAGIEVDLSTLWKQGKAGLKVGMASIAVPFFFAFLVAWLAPQALGKQPDANPLVFALVLAIAMSISALPIIAKTLMDMDLYRSDLGMVVISAAIFNDLIGWIVFAIILGLMGESADRGNNIMQTITLTIAFAAGILTIGRWLIHRVLPFVQAYTRWPGGELSFALILAMLGAAFTEWIGIHAIFGAFLVGAAIGDSAHLRESTRVTIDHFVSFIFAPVFFASIGLKVDFLAHFDLPLVLTVLGLVCVVKLAGGVLGARWGGMPAQEARAVGFAMVSVGAMGIIIGLLALQAGIISQRLFVALVIMAIATSMMSGPGIRLILRPSKRWRLQDSLLSKLFFRELKAVSRRNVIHEMTTAVCEAISGLNIEAIEAAVWDREEALSTGLGKGIALPHARIEGLKEAIVAVGISDTGIDFDAPDGKPANIIFLLLTPRNDPRVQLVIGSEIARCFREPKMLEQVLRTKNFTDFLALIKSFR